MPTDSSGVYSLPPGYLAVLGENAEPSQHNAPLEDIAAALSSRLPRNGAAPMTAPFKLADGTVTAPALTFNADADTGFYKTANGFGVSVGGIMVAEFGAGGLILGGTPIGSLQAYAGTTAPDGWLFSYGQAVSRTTYAALFAATGTTYGDGDGSATFNLPDLRGRVPFGADGIGGTPANRIRVATTITTTSGSASATVASATGITIGAFIEAENVPSGTTVSALSGTTITMSANATAAASGTDAVFSQFTESGGIGGVGGAAAHVLTEAELPEITPEGAVSRPTISISGGTVAGFNSGGSGAGGTTIPIGAAAIVATSSIPIFTGAPFGSGVGHNTLPPGIVCNYIIFAGI